MNMAWDWIWWGWAYCDVTIMDFFKQFIEAQHFCEQNFDKTFLFYYVWSVYRGSRDPNGITKKDKKVIFG